MRALLSVSLVLLALLLSAVPASAAQTVSDLGGPLDQFVRLDCKTRDPFCHFRCTGGPVGLLCDYDSTHGTVSCVVLIRLTSTCINPLPQHG